MTKPIIEVENLSKLYHLGQIGSTTLRESFEAWWSRMKQKKSQTGLKPNTLWALKDVSFSVGQGEIVGLIGRNGAGKSTLLKVLSRITDPTKGRAILRGRVASLLEVGTGFHPELTGRENIYLNGTILGMRRKEIDKKFDEIVAFANLEKFLDTPVKHYSSGMYVRLGFAVAAHLENEILLVDEVLAVGDIEFQRKCLGKMHEVARVGRTVLFISHNMPAIVSLCGRCLLMDSGVILSSGLASDVVSGYYKGGKFLSSSVIFSKKPPVGDDLAVLLEGHVALSNGDHASEVDINQPCQIEMKFEILKEANVSFIPSFHFYTSEGTSAFVASMPTAKRLKAGRHTAICKIPPNFLNDKVYFVGLALTALGNGLKANFFENNALSFIVKDPIEGTRGRNGYAGPIPGEVRPQFEWMIEPSGQAQ